MESLQTKQELSATYDKYDCHMDVKIEEYSIQVELNQKIDSIVQDCKNEIETVTNQTTILDNH